VPNSNLESGDPVRTLWVKKSRRATCSRRGGTCSDSGPNGRRASRRCRLEGAVFKAARAQRYPPTPHRKDRATRPRRSRRLPHRRRKTATYLLGRASQRVRVQVRVALRRACLRVPEELANDRQPEAGPGAEACMGVPQVVNAKACEARPLEMECHGLLRSARGFSPSC
jgi:hypothetical protein